MRLRNLRIPARLNQEVLSHVRYYCSWRQTIPCIPGRGGRQYRVSQGDVIYIDKVNQEADSKISFDVLMIGGEGDVKVGNPTIEGAKVEGKVIAQVKGEKITVYKYKSKKDTKRKIGHRQPYTKVEITAINA